MNSGTENSGTAPALEERIDDLLPQTQCTRCGYAGCRPYAEAVARAEAQINQCPPGGQATIDALARLLDRPTLELNPAHGIEAPWKVACIDETRCIGCARCLPACPVDAIIGAAKYMHTVIADRCTGCELCLAPCPVDCIEMRPSPASTNDPSANRARFAAHRARLANRAAQRKRRLDEKKVAAHRPDGP